MASEIAPRPGSIGKAIGMAVALENRMASLEHRLAMSLDASGPAARYAITELRSMRAILTSVADELRDVADQEVL